LIRSEKGLFRVKEDEGKPTFFKLVTVIGGNPQRIPLKPEEISQLFVDFLAGRAKLVPEIQIGSFTRFRCVEG
jgi:hypothetical protein